MKTKITQNVTKYALSTLSLIAAAGMIVSASAQAASAELRCPKHTHEILRCEAADMAGDHVVAIQSMDGAVICEDGKTTSHFMLMSVPGESKSSPEIPVTQTMRVGSTLYSSARDKVAFTLTLKMSHPSRPNATFTTEFVGSEGNVKISRSLKCR